jgi:hypothetical protein
MTRDSASETLTGDTSIYGCPPGVVTTHCPNPPGAPKKFIMLVSGFTGANAAATNRSWTLTWVSGETWSQNVGGITVTYTYSSGSFVLTFKLNSDSSILATYTGTVSCCTTSTLTKVSAPGYASSPSTLSIVPATGCGKGTAWTPVLDMCKDSCGRPSPRLRFTSGSGSGTKTITFMTIGCTTDSSGTAILFSTDDPLLCTGDPAVPCGDNYLIVQVTCLNCNVCNCASGVSWAGPGWYCASNLGCQYYTSDPTPAVTLCAGPFATEFVCNNSITLTGCGSPPCTLPKVMCINITYIGPGSAPNTCADIVGVGSGITFPVALSSCGYWTPWIGGSCNPSDHAGEFNRLNFYYTAGSDDICRCCFCVNGSLGVHLFETDYNGCMPQYSACGSLPISGTFQVFCPDFTYALYQITASDGAGCVQNPPAVTYNCTSGGCVDPGDGSGTFSGTNALTDCLADCSGGGGGGAGPNTDCGEGAASPPDSLVITGGPHAGTYTGTWHAGSPPYETFNVPLAGSSGFQTLTLEFYSGQWHLVKSVGGVTDEVATGGTCSPFHLAFSGSTLGAGSAVLN